MNSRRVAVVVFAFLFLLTGVRRGWAKPVPNDTSDFAAADAQILSEIRDHSEAMANLEYLSDEIAPRRVRRS